MESAHTDCSNDTYKPYLYDEKNFNLIRGGGLNSEHLKKCVAPFRHLQISRVIHCWNCLLKHHQIAKNQEDQGGLLFSGPTYWTIVKKEIMVEEWCTKKNCPTALKLPDLARNAIK